MTRYHRAIRHCRAICGLALLAAGLLLAAVLAGCGNDGGLPAPTATAAPPADTPRPTATATANPSATPAPTQTPSPEPASHIPPAPDRDLYQLASELIPGADFAVDRPAPPQVGDRRAFQLVDFRYLELNARDFTLRLVTPRAYWFFEDGLDVKSADIERAAAQFEDVIYPRVTGAMGQEWIPGIDGDPRLYILNADLHFMGGYYSPADEHPQSVRPISNEIEAVYINAATIAPGTAEYARTLAHELQHAIHWRADPSEDTWVNEGLSELAMTIAGLTDYGLLFAGFGPTSLTVWPVSPGSGVNYVSASSFMHYLTEHYGGRDDLRPLLAQPADGIDGVNAYLKSAGYAARFQDVFRDWAVARLLDESSGRYSFGGADVTPPKYQTLRLGEAPEFSLPQYATEYVRLAVPRSVPVRLSFDGADAAPLLPPDAAGANGGCWWSNNGDDINSTLTRALDLRQARDPVLTYRIWYAIEADWDFAYLQASADGGATWQIIETALTSADDPLNLAYGPGYTGESGGWQAESVSLAPWAGREILLRFQYVTDAAINDHGLCLRDAAVAGIPPAAAGEWTPAGFFWNAANRVRQQFIVQIIHVGDESRVIPLELDAGNRGEITLNPGPETRYTVIAVQSLAPATRLPAGYALELAAAE